MGTNPPTHPVPDNPLYLVIILLRQPGLVLNKIPKHPLLDDPQHNLLDLLLLLHLPLLLYRSLRHSLVGPVVADRNGVRTQVVDLALLAGLGNEVHVHYV